jgi:hypothetical protein
MPDVNACTTELVQRIERIERQNRNLRRCLTGLAALLVGAAVALPTYQALSQGRGRAVVEADRFVLRNNDGKLVAAFGVNNYGTANLVLLDKQEHARATIGVNNNGDPAIVLASPGGQQRLTLIHTADGPGLVMMDKNDKPRLLVSVEADGKGLFQTIGPDGKAIWSQQ